MVRNMNKKIIDDLLDLLDRARNIPDLTGSLLAQKGIIEALLLLLE